MLLLRKCRTANRTFPDCGRTAVAEVEAREVPVERTEQPEQLEREVELAVQAVQRVHRRPERPLVPRQPERRVLLRLEIVAEAADNVEVALDKLEEARVPD